MDADEAYQLDPENFGHNSRITARTRRSLQNFQDLLHARTLLGTGSSFLFGEMQSDELYQYHQQQQLLHARNNSESNMTDNVWQNRKLNETSSEHGAFLAVPSRSRQGADDLKVFNFVDSTKQLILKGWNSRQFRRHKLAAYNWSYKAPQPLMDGRYFCCMAAKDICEPAALTAATINSGVNIFTPKHGVSAGNTLRENCGILFFTKDIDFDYKLTLRHMRNSHPKLLSSRYYVPFLTFVRALRCNRAERAQPRRIYTKDLLRGLCWILLLVILLLSLILLMEDPQILSKNVRKKKMLLSMMIIAPPMSFLLGFCS